MHKYYIHIIFFSLSSYVVAGEQTSNPQSLVALCMAKVCEKPLSSKAFEYILSSETLFDHYKSNTIPDYGSMLCGLYYFPEIVLGQTSLLSPREIPEQYKVRRSARKLLDRLDSIKVRAFLRHDGLNLFAFLVEKRSIIDMYTGKEVYQSFETGLYPIAINNTGQYAVFVDQTRTTITIKDMKNETERVLDIHDGDHDHFVTRAALSNTGKLLAVTINRLSSDYIFSRAEDRTFKDKNCLKIFDVTSGKEIFERYDEKNCSLDYIFSDDDQHFITVEGESEEWIEAIDSAYVRRPAIIVWNTNSFEPLRQYDLNEWVILTGLDQAGSLLRLQSKAGKIVYYPFGGGFEHFGSIYEKFEDKKDHRKAFFINIAEGMLSTFEMPKYSGTEMPWGLAHDGSSIICSLWKSTMEASQLLIIDIAEQVSLNSKTYDEKERAQIKKSSKAPEVFGRIEDINIDEDNMITVLCRESVTRACDQKSEDNFCLKRYPLPDGFNEAHQRVINNLKGALESFVEHADEAKKSQKDIHDVGENGTDTVETSLLQKLSSYEQQKVNIFRDLLDIITAQKDITASIDRLAKKYMRYPGLPYFVENTLSSELFCRKIVGDDYAKDLSGILHNARSNKQLYETAYGNNLSRYNIFDKITSHVHRFHSPRLNRVLAVLQELYKIEHSPDPSKIILQSQLFIQNPIKLKYKQNLNKLRWRLALKGNFSLQEIINQKASANSAVINDLYIEKITYRHRSSLISYQILPANIVYTKKPKYLDNGELTLTSFESSYYGKGFHVPLNFVTKFDLQSATKDKSIVGLQLAQLIGDNKKVLSEENIMKLYGAQNSKEMKRYV